MDSQSKGTKTVENGEIYKGTIILVCRVVPLGNTRILEKVWPPVGFKLTLVRIAMRRGFKLHWKLNFL